MALTSATLCVDASCTAAASLAVMADMTEAAAEAACSRLRLSLNCAHECVAAGRA
jgi:hypothetical protein